MLAVLGVIAYAGYDYFVFKTLVVNYMPRAALEELYSQHLGVQHRRSFSRDFDRMVISVVTERLAEIADDAHTYLYAPGEFSEVMATDREIASAAEIRPLCDDTVYLYLPNISPRTREFVQTNREYLAAYENLVLDLRGNYGGWMPAFHAIADLFVPQGAVVSREYANLPLLTRAITSRTPAYFSFEKITVLQDQNTASAAESLILALSAHVPGVVTVGETTFGKGTGQVTIPLTGRYALRATVFQVKSPTGQNIHQMGIPPDIKLYSPKK